MLQLNLKENIKADLVFLTIPSREQQVLQLLSSLSSLNPKKYNLVFVCNTEKNKDAEEFTQRVIKNSNLKLKTQIIYNSEKTIPTGRNKGLLKSISNMKKGTRLTYIIDDDILIHKPEKLFSFLEQGLQYTAFVSYPSFHVSGLSKTKSRQELNKIIKEIQEGNLEKDCLEYMSLEKPRNYTPFKGQKYEIARVLYGHVHGNLLLFLTKTLEEIKNNFDEEHILDPLREWYGEWTELNYRLQRFGLIGGYFYRSSNNRDHLDNANEWGLIIHNNLEVSDSPTRTMATRNTNMLKSYIYLAIESNIVPLDIPQEELMDRFIKLLDCDYRFLKKDRRELAKLLQLRYSTKKYLFGKENISHNQFIKRRKKIILNILKEIFTNKELHSVLVKKKMNYENAPFNLAPFEQLSTFKFDEVLRHQNDLLKPFREDVFKNE